MMNAITQPILSNADMLDAVRSMSVLAVVKVGMFSADKSSAELMNELQREAGSTGRVGKITINTLTGADDLLDKARSEYTHFRVLHYTRTLPWVSDPNADRQRGPRLLPNMIFEDYLGAMGAQKREAEKARDNFLFEYPDAIIRARKNIAADLADETGQKKALLKMFIDGYQYPGVDHVRSTFKVAFDFEPIPVGAQFANLPPAIMGKLSASLEKKQLAMVETAQRHMWETLRERVEKLMERMSDADAKFKLTTVENVRELIAFLPGWNITNNPGITEIVGDLESMLANVDSDAIRGSADVRADVAQQAAKVVEKLNAWGF